MSVKEHPGDTATSEQRARALPDGVVVLDIETQEMVPESRDLSGMHVSLVGVRTGNRTLIFSEEQMPAMFGVLDVASVIVGHNLLGFDYKVLQRYATFDVVARYKEKTFDILRVIERKTDRRVALQDLATRNLSAQKLGSGKDAPMLFAQGRMDELIAYLEQDLLLVQGLLEVIEERGALRYGHIVYKEPIERDVPLSITER